MFKRFDIDEVQPLFPNAHKWLVVGIRRIGKSFSIERNLVTQAIVKGKPFIYVGRWAEDVKGQAVADAFLHLITNPSGNNIIKKLLGDNYSDDVCFKVMQKKLYLVRDSADSKTEKLHLIAYITALPNAPRFKNGTYPNCTDVFFDEFITLGSYTPREVTLFNMITNTLAVDGAEPFIYMCGNPDNEIEFCPYLTAYGLSYDDVEDNTAVLLDDDTVFVKVTRSDGAGVVKKSTATSFGASGQVALTGQIDRPKVTPVIDYDLSDVVCRLVLETPTVRVLDRNERKKIWVDIIQTEQGIYSIFKQHQGKRLNVPTITSKWDSEPSHIYEVYRGSAKGPLSKVISLMLQSVNENRVYYDTPRTANEVRNIINGW